MPWVVQVCHIRPTLFLKMSECSFCVLVDYFFLTFLRLSFTRVHLRYAVAKATRRRIDEIEHARQTEKESDLQKYSQDKEKERIARESERTQEFERHRRLTERTSAIVQHSFLKRTQLRIFLSWTMFTQVV